jgi:hypothetical protein
MTPGLAEHQPEAHKEKNQAPDHEIGVVSSGGESLLEAPLWGWLTVDDAPARQSSRKAASDVSFADQNAAGDIEGKADGLDPRGRRP